MSYQAMAWATSIKLPMTEKIVLLMLANRASHDDGSCYPSINRVAEECGIDRRTVIRATKKLEDKGLLAVSRSKRINDENNINRYFLNIGGSVTESLGSVTESLGGSVTESPKPVSSFNQSVNQSVNKNISAHADTCKPKKTKPEFNGIDCLSIFNHWKIAMGHPQSHLLDKRKKLIQKTLDSGYTPIQAKLAIDGHKKSAWHKENGFDGIEYSLKPENIDKFIKMAGMTDAEVKRTKPTYPDWVESPDF